MKKNDDPKVQGFPIDDISHRISYEAMKAAQRELQNWDDKINEHLKESGKGLELSSQMKFHLKFTIKPINNVKPKASGEKSRKKVRSDKRSEG